MAENRTGKVAQFERSRGQRYTELTYGNTVRTAEAQEKYTQNTQETSQQVLRNRARVRHMDMRYVLFLSICAVLTVMVCIHYLKLHAQYTYYQKKASALTLELNNLRMENDTTYNEIVSGVDLAEIKERAIQGLGMTYPKQSQIVTYESPDSDYVKQYEEIPDKAR